MGSETVDAQINRLAEQVIGAAIEVHRELGPGFAEQTYSRALQIELDSRQIPYQTEVMTHSRYKGKSIGEGRIDLLIDGELIVELKSAEANPRKYAKQVVCYLRSTQKRLGLVINFEANRMVEGIARVIV